MDEHDVLKPFNTVNRRFRPDDERCNVVRSDDHLEPHSIETLKARGFIKERGEAVALPTSVAAEVPPNKLEVSRPATPATSEK
ncbi:Tfp pilus assembly protein PilP [Bradyrhizobium sp. USDA 4011]|uniref:Uncharacterized protein n=1 Tax=Bradyrhizobium erythrophlei TaxID=1437360 RepID=A0A1H4NVJ7_9BRAD|nr:MULTISPECIES: hypothetical protein [Bradyrhizobium]UFX42068.1 hypothetical protein HAP47_0022675 [Bradyrhizobium sp. 41S5]SEB99065.1 hypothetical protein SAMN05444164_0740 [Bradyrhizobium erythrophlei]